MGYLDFEQKKNYLEVSPFSPENERISVIKKL